MPAFVFLPLASSLIASTTGGALAIAGAEAGFLVGSGALASTLSSITVSAAALAGSYALQQLNQPKPKASPGQIQSRQSLPARRVVFGRDKVAGPLFFLAIGQDGAVYRGTILSEGPIDAVEEVWLADTNSGIVAGTGSNTAAPWLNTIGVESGLGGPGAGVSASLAAAFTEWTAAHRLDGIAWMVLKAGLVQPKFFQKFYPSFIPAEREVIRGIKPIDPRTGVAAWSENCAVITLHVMRDARQGLGIPDSAIDLASFAAKAALDDEAVPQYGGGTAARYACGGVYELVEGPKDVLGKLLAAGDAELYLDLDGKWALSGGKAETASFTVTDGMIRGVRYAGGAGKLDGFNRLKISYTSPLHDYQAVEAQPWEDADSLAAGTVLSQDFALPFVRNHSQARRLAKIAMAKGNPRHKLTLTCSVAALPALGARRIRLQSEVLGLDEEFRRAAISIAGDLSTVTLTLESLPAEAYNWAGAAEEGPPPPVPTALAATPTPPDPVNLHLTPQTRVITPAGTATLLRLTEDAPSASWVTFAGRIRRATGGSFRKMAPDGDWAVLSAEPVETMDYVVVDGVNTASLGVDEAGTLIGGGSAYVAPTAAPAAPTGAAFSLSGGLARIDWINPAATDFWAIRIYEVSTTPAVLRQQIFQWPTPTQFWVDPDATPGARYYRVYAVSPTGVQGAASGPANGVV